MAATVSTLFNPFQNLCYVWYVLHQMIKDVITIVIIAVTITDYYFYSSQTPMKCQPLLRGQPFNRGLMQVSELIEDKK